MQKKIEPNRINAGIFISKLLQYSFINVACICSACTLFPQLEKIHVDLLLLLHIISTKESHEQFYDQHPEWSQSYFTSSRKQRRKVTAMTPGSMINYSPERPFR